MLNRKTAHPLKLLLIGALAMTLLPPASAKDAGLPQAQTDTASAAKVATVRAYFKAFADRDAEALAGLFATDGVIEDPVGSAPHTGTQAIRAFYEASFKAGVTTELVGPVHPTADYAAFQLKVSLPEMVIDVIDTMKFDAGGKVTELHTFWGNTNIAPRG